MNKQQILEFLGVDKVFIRDYYLNGYVEDNKIYYQYRARRTYEISEIFASNKDSHFEEIGFIKDGKAHVNADNEFSIDFIDDRFLKSFYLYSFKCLEELWGNDIEYEVLDSWQATSKPIPSKPEELKKDIKNGWTLHNKKLHKAGSVLIKSGNLYAILGFDDTGDQYYGIELRHDKEPKTLKTAFKQLVPDYIDKTKIVSRQGEWFFVQDSPPSIECFTLPRDSHSNYIYMPLDHPDSNIHELYSDEIRIMGDKIWAYYPVMCHDEHDTVSLDGWHLIVKNTAARAVSVEGVD